MHGRRWARQEKETKEGEAKHLTTPGRVPTPQLMRCQKDARIPFSKQTKTGLMAKPLTHNSRSDVEEGNGTEKERRREWERRELGRMTNWDGEPAFLWVSLAAIFRVYPLAPREKAVKYHLSLN